jgi:hypothetical protein
MTEDERSLVEQLRQAFPAAFGYELDGEKDRQMQKLAERLIASNVIERIEHTGRHQDIDGELVETEPVKSASYRLHPDFVADLGGGGDSDQN